MKFVLHISIASILFVSCIKTDPVSPVPRIVYQKLDVSYYRDTILYNLLPIGKLEFEFIDGDADFGIYAEDTNSFDWNVNNYNVFLTPYYKLNGEFKEIEFDSNTVPPPWKTIFHNPRLDRVGQNRTIQGTISIDIYDVPLGYDTIRYEFFIRDRAGNSSNVQITDEVSIATEEIQ